MSKAVNARIIRTITTAISNGEIMKAKIIIKETCAYEKMTGESIISSVTMHDLKQSIAEREAELSQPDN